jgi:hypothetical protein
LQALGASRFLLLRPLSPVFLWLLLDILPIAKCLVPFMLTTHSYPLRVFAYVLIESVRARKQPERLTDAPAPKTKKAKTTKSPKPAKAAKGKKAAAGAKGAKKGTKKAKKEKDPNAPKRPLTAFMFFSKDVRATVKAENPNMTFGELGTAIAAKWAKATPAEKKKYEAQAAKDKTRYASFFSLLYLSVFSVLIRSLQATFSHVLTCLLQ